MLRKINLKKKIKSNAEKTQIENSNLCLINYHFGNFCTIWISHHYPHCNGCGYFSTYLDDKCVFSLIPFHHHRHRRHVLWFVIQSKYTHVQSRYVGHQFYPDILTRCTCVYLNIVFKRFWSERARSRVLILFIRAIIYVHIHIHIQIGRFD